MLKATAQERSGTPLAVAGIVLGLFLPAFLVLSRLGDRDGALSPYDLTARLVLFSAPACLGVLALFHRPTLFMAASASTAIALPMHVFALPMLVAAVLWAVACDRSRALASAWATREVIATFVAVVFVLAAAATFYFAPSPLVCVSTRVGSTTCSTAFFLPGRSLVVLGIVVAGLIGASVLTPTRRRVDG